MALGDFPQEMWTLGGVLMGTLIPAGMTFINGRAAAKHESNRMLIDLWNAVSPTWSPACVRRVRPAVL